MNKLKLTIAGLFIACLGIGSISAQSADQTPPKKVTPTATATTGATASKGTAASTTAKPGQHLKKDGTPDMRYKENKAAAGKTAPKKAATTPTK